MTTTPFEILPSIDLRGGLVVDLYQGDYARETVYDDPAERFARRFLDEGAAWLHVVDLDGARAGAPANAMLVGQLSRIAHASGARLQLGGGIRSASLARAAIDAGADRVIFGTAAVEHPEEVAAAVRDLGAGAVVVGIDGRDGMVATRGWLATSGRTTIDLAEAMIAIGVARFVCTDIARDSTLTGPNVAELDALNRAVLGRAAIIASGGVTTASQIGELVAAGLEGAIVGSALYAGRLTVAQAIAASRAVGA
jgi:phosphoribosylformimino-5-aminoimidazole carboxamide ribotide isomerase